MVLTITLIFAFVIVYVPQPPKQAEAQGLGGVVTDIKHTLVSVGNAISSGATAVATAASAAFGGALNLKEFTLDGIANAIAKAVVSAMVASLVDWINSGFHGSPAFISDLGGFLLNAADQGASQYIESLGNDLSFLCSPFKLDIQIALAIEYQNARENRPYQGCTISGIIDNLEGFLEGTFEEDGWQKWFNLTAQPEKYTPYGQYLEAERRMNSTIAATVDNERETAKWGSGFMSGKVCENIDGPGNVPSTLDPRLNPGINDPIKVTPIGDINVGPIPDFSAPQEGQVIPDRQGLAPSSNTIIPPDSTLVLKRLPDARPLAQASVSSGTRLKCAISKPGRMIADSLSKALGAGQDTLITADEINEIVGALIGQLATKAVTGINGLLGLSAGTGHTYSGFNGGSYTSAVNNEGAFAAQSASNNAVSSAGDLVLDLQDSLQVQEDLKALADRQIPILQTYLQGRITADQRAQAQAALDHALEIQSRAPSFIQSIIPLINQAQALQLEYERTGTTLERKTAITQELLAIDTQFNRIDPYRQGELTFARANWDPTTFN